MTEMSFIERFVSASLAIMCLAATAVLIAFLVQMILCGCSIL